MAENIPLGFQRDTQAVLEQAKLEQMGLYLILYFPNSFLIRGETEDEKHQEPC